jgi:outer membrane protein TolC
MRARVQDRGGAGYYRPGMKSLLLGAFLAGTALSGCATFSKDGGFDSVAATTRLKLGQDVRWARSAGERAKSDAEVAALLEHPLAVDDAVQVALLNNPGLQAAFAELGISEADLVESGRLPNPRFTLRHSSAGGLYDIEETLTFNVLSLLTVPYAHATEKRRFAQVQTGLVMQVADLADRTRTAYYTAVAARESLHYAWQVKDAAQTSAELAHRMQGAGNWNRMEQAQQQGFYDQALQDLARAQLADQRAAAELDRLLGLRDGAVAVRLSEHLPELPTNIAMLPSLEQTAMQSRLDLQLMRSQIDELARRLKLTKATRFVDVLDVGPTRVRNGTENDPYEKGYEVSLEIPIFDSGDARVRKAEAIYAQAVDRLAQAAVDARADVRQAAAQYQTAYILAVRQHDDVIPLSRAIAKQELLRYNASLISIFDLLANSRATVASVNDYIQSARDFWIAKSHLDTVLVANTPRAARDAAW